MVSHHVRAEWPPPSNGPCPACSFMPAMSRLNADHYSYTKAIEVSIRKDPVFFSNRAACALFHAFLRRADSADLPGYTNFAPPEYEKCVADCDEALALDRA